MHVRPIICTLRSHLQRAFLAPHGAIASTLLVTLLLAGCSFDSPTEAIDDPGGATPESTTNGGNAHGVQDLEVVSASGSQMILSWTQVEDGTGEPARYLIKHGVTSFDWQSGAVGCEHVGDEVGAEATCVVEGLAPNTSYDLQVMSFRSTDAGGVAEGAVMSGVVSGRTGDATPGDFQILEEVAPSTTLPSKGGVWIKRTDVSRLPRTGSAWNNVRSAADERCGSVRLHDMTSSANVCIMAKALVFAATTKSRHREDVISAIEQIVRSGRYSGTALALGRELGAYVIAADLIDLKRHDPELDRRFRSKLRELRTTRTRGGGVDNLVECHERRPNNWGAHCGFSRAAIASYLGDRSELRRTAMVFKGYLGDRSAYRGFSFGNTSWQCDRYRPVGVNGTCERNGVDLSGVLPDDQRRGGKFRSSPPRENYVWEAHQGLLAQAVILHGAGYDVWSWERRALRRSVQWLHDVADYPADGDDEWQPHLVNHYYGTNFPTSRSPRPGKNVGWTDWTHAR